MKLFGPHTLKDEYHAALKRELRRGQFTAPLQEHILTTLQDARPDTYVALASLAHDYGTWALKNGINIYLEGVPDVRQELKERADLEAMQADREPRTKY